MFQSQVRAAADGCLSAFVAGSNPGGAPLLVSALLEGMARERAWQTKEGALKVRVCERFVHCCWDLGSCALLGVWGRCGCFAAQCMVCSLNMACNQNSQFPSENEAEAECFACSPCGSCAQALKALAGHAKAAVAAALPDIVPVGSECLVDAREQVGVVGLV